MKLSFYGADQCVTGSCHCLEVNGRKILIDCGLQQGRDEIDNGALPFHPGSIDFVLITHAHIDHTGRVPMLVKQGFQGRILTTRVTANLMDIMLLDSAHIQESDAEWKNRKAERSGAPKVEPLYTVEDAENVKQYVTTCEYGQDVELYEGVSVHKELVLLKFPGVEDMNAALTYKGKELYIRRSDVVLPEGEYFDDELIGLEVHDCDTGTLLGILTAVDEYPASKVYTVKGDREILIPAVRDAFIRSVDLDAGRMDVKVWEGL